MKNYIILIAAFALIATAGVGHYLTDLGYISIGSGNTTITDMANRTLTVPSPIDHVLATSPTTTAMVYMIAPDKLLAFNYQMTSEEQSLMPDAYKDLPSVGGWYGSQTGSYEQFISMNPNVVLDSVTPDDSGATDSSTLAVLESDQQQFGSIPVVGVDDTSNLTTFNPSIIFLGKLLGAGDKAQKLADFNTKVQKEVNDVVSKIPESERVTVYYARSANGLQTAPAGSTHAQTIDLCGGINVADVSGGRGMSMVSVSMEQILNWNPEVIITTDPTFYANIYKNSSWSGITAVKNKRVYLSPQNPFKWFDQPTGANKIIGIPWTAKILYPDKFQSLNLTSEAKEFYSEFYHYDLSDDDINKILEASGMNSSMIS